jgi:DNA-binding transcriptional LysR family regulator
MDIRELRYFSAVFGERNLTAAARRCFVSQPSISAAITNLEAELGTTLFIRHKKGVAPTASAERFHAIARRIIDQADAARNLFRESPKQRTLTIGLMRTLDTRRTVELLKPLTGHSDLALRLVGARDAADARIISRNMLSRDEHFVPLWSERYVAALPSSHPLTLKHKLRTADLAGVPLIDRCFCERGDVFRRYAPPRMPAAIAETKDWAIALVAAGVGVAIVPEGVVRANAEVAVREIEIKVTREVGLAYSAKRPPSDALRDLVARVRKQRPATKSTRRSPPRGKPGVSPAS